MAARLSTAAITIAISLDERKVIARNGGIESTGYETGPPLFPKFKSSILSANSIRRIIRRSFLDAASRVARHNFAINEPWPDAWTNRLVRSFVAEK